MKNLHIIMPMGGLGTRTSDMYKTPKPFIKLFDKYLFEYPLNGLSTIRNVYKTKLTMVVRQEMMNSYLVTKLNQIGWKFADEFNLVQIDHLTRGSLETVMQAEKFIDDNDIVIVLDCDFAFKSNDLYNIIDRIDEQEDIDGFLLSFNSDLPRYSYADIDENNIVKRTAEKNPISNHALAGVYGFSNGTQFKKYANEILARESDYNEYYVSAVYNYMINDGARIILSHLDEYTSLGTSEEIMNFRLSDNKFKKLHITDFDGTLFDTREANYLAYKETLKKVYDYELKPEDYYDNFGLRINELLKKLKLDVDKLSDVKKTKARVYKKYFNKIQINNNLYSHLRYAKQNNNIVCLATTASKKNVENLLKYFEIKNLFDYIITGEDVSNGKPDPEVYQKTIMKYSFISTDNIYIYEDSDVGFLAAHKSGVKNIVDVNNVFTFNKFIDINEFNKLTKNNQIILD